MPPSRKPHPRFLIHDGPREGDMARVIYERFFIYVVELEKVFPSGDDANFQYLITTTTPPPKSMRQSSAGSSTRCWIPGKRISDCFRRIFNWAFLPLH
jgi:hypothetical protein